MNTTHICRFVGKRLPPEPGPLGKCELCSKRAVGGALFAWGAAALCAKHLTEECGPEGSPSEGISHDEK